MTAAHRDHEHLPGELAIILSGRKDPLHGLLTASPALAARFPAIIDFPGYTPDQLATIVTALAREAGLCLTPTPSAKPPPSSPMLRNATPPATPAWPSGYQGNGHYLR
ncbi:MAG TPA: hypothetical protein VGD83_24260 [Streptosporangiaceae bacterium]